MFVPEYTITQETLSNIATIEYSKAVVDNTTILPAWERKLQKETRTSALFHSAYELGLNIQFDAAKRFVDGLLKNPPQELENLNELADLTIEIAIKSELEEEDLKTLHKILSKNLLPKPKQGVYRSKILSNKTNPDEILAQLVELLDWLNSLDAKETHPIITTAVFRASLEIMHPFETFNKPVANFASNTMLKMLKYDLQDSINLIAYYHRSQRDYEQIIDSFDRQEPDFTRWIEYFTEGIATESSNLKEKVQLLARDTKIAKATGRAKLTKRQEKIVEFLQDYGILRNNDFPRLFPKISEDTVLRDLKVLIDKGIVNKRGSTKASRYELS